MTTRTSEARAATIREREILKGSCVELACAISSTVSQWAFAICLVHCTGDGRRVFDLGFKPEDQILEHADGSTLHITESGLRSVREFFAGRYTRSIAKEFERALEHFDHEGITWRSDTANGFAVAILRDTQNLSEAIRRAEENCHSKIEALLGNIDRKECEYVQKIGLGYIRFVKEKYPGEQPSTLLDDRALMNLLMFYDQQNSTNADSTRDSLISLLEQRRILKEMGGT